MYLNLFVVDENLIGSFTATRICWVSPTEDGSTEALLQILYDPNLILGVFGSYMF